MGGNLKVIIRPLWYFAAFLWLIAFVVDIIIVGIVFGKPLYHESTNQYTVEVLNGSKVITQEEFEKLTTLFSTIDDIFFDISWYAITYIGFYEIILWRFDPKGKVSPLGYRGDNPVKRK